jgi:hypothetical protein
MASPSLRIVDDFVVDHNRSLSHSQMGTFARCRQQYAYKYLKGLKPLARDMHLDSWERMNRGILIHAGMEYGFLGQPAQQGVEETAAGIKANNVLSDEQKFLLFGEGASPNVGSMVADSIAVANEALAWLPASDWEPVIYNGQPMVEARLELPLAPWKGWVGYADLVARHKPTGRVLVIDYKTRERFEADGADTYNAQFAAYAYALQRMGVRCDGSLLFEIKPVPPKRSPRVVRDDVGGVDGVRISTDGRFRTTPTFRSPKFLEEVWRDIERTAQAIATLKPADIFRNMSSFNCATCSFVHLCMAEANGEDAQDVLEQHFSNAPAPRSAGGQSGLNITV